MFSAVTWRISCGEPVPQAGIADFTQPGENSRLSGPSSGSPCCPDSLRQPPKQDTQLWNEVQDTVHVLCNADWISSGTIRFGYGAGDLICGRASTGPSVALGKHFSAAKERLALSEPSLSRHHCQNPQSPGNGPARKSLALCRRAAGRGCGRLRPRQSRGFRAHAVGIGSRDLFSTSSEPIPRDIGCEESVWDQFLLSAPDPAVAVCGKLGH